MTNPPTSPGSPWLQRRGRAFLKTFYIMEIVDDRVEHERTRWRTGSVYQP